MATQVKGVVRVGLIGSGGISNAHGKGFIKHASKIKVVALCDVSAENLKKRSEQLKDVGVDLCHGSPVRLEEFEYIFAPEQARECLPMYDELAHLTLIGHSHLCKVFALTSNSVEELQATDFKLDSDRRYIVSVGSVGQPRDYDNRASYTIYDSDEKRFYFRRIEYDIESAAEKVLKAKLERNFAHRLYIGV